MLLRWLTYAAVLIFAPDYVFLENISRNKRSNDYIPCDHGWFYFKNKCYRIGGTRQTENWEGASKHCTELGATLATIESVEENDFLVALLLLDVKRSAWIGLNDRGNESDYQWHSGSTSEYRNWRPLEPSGESREDEDCVQLLVDLYYESVGQWNDNDCGHSIAFICEKSSDPKLKSPNNRYCTSNEGGGFRFGSSCYHPVTQMKTWEEAEQHCMQEYSGHLITILDKTVDFYLTYVFLSMQSEMWIGIKIRDQFQQKWSSGWYVGYNGFNTEYRDFIEGTCVVRSQRKKWNIVPCSKRYTFVCEKSHGNVPVLKLPVKDSYCPSVPADWRDLDGEFCYFVETENTASWYEANFQCMRRGGNLLSLHSKEEGDILNPFIRFSGAAAFIGLFRLYGRENTFGWTDGTEVGFQNWNPGEPNNENEKCAEARGGDMQWNDIRCDEKRAYICAVRKIAPNVTITSTEKPAPREECTGDISTKAIIGVAVCIVLVVILLGVVIYNFRPKIMERKKISSPVGLQSRPAREVNPPKYRSSEMKVNDEDSYYESMDV